MVPLCYHFWSAHWEIQWGKKALGQRLRQFVYKDLAYCIVDSERCFRTFSAFVSPSGSPQNSWPNKKTASGPLASHRIFRPPFLIALLLFSIGIIFSSFFLMAKRFWSAEGWFALKFRSQEQQEQDF
jgi:hypothetical protein